MFVFVYQLSTTCAFGFWRVGVWVFSLRFTEVEMFVCVCLFVINQPPAFGFGFELSCVVGCECCGHGVVVCVCVCVK